jgi:hypothetical protein
MTDSYIKGNEVYFSNGTKCGDIEYDKSWDEWRFIPREGCKFSAAWLIDIGLTIKRLR